MHVRSRIIRTGVLLTAAVIICVTSVMSDRMAAIAASEMEDSKKIAITFDDGPHPYYTEQLLDGLKERGVKATFFCDRDACGTISGCDQAHE